MSLKLEDVKGLGKKTVEILKETGIDTVEKLANTELEKLSEIKGIGTSSAKKFLENAKSLLTEISSDSASIDAEVKEEKEKEVESEDKLKEEEQKKKEEEQKKIEEELKKIEEKKTRLQEKKVEPGDFVLVKITGKSHRGTVFRVSSEEDAKKAGIYDEKDAQLGYYTPEFVIVGKAGFLNEGLTETIEQMNYFEKKSVRIPPAKAFGKRDPKKIERIGIAKYRKLNEGKYPEIGQKFLKKSQQGQHQRGTVVRIAQGKVMVDYNHPLAGQHVEYNLEIVDKIEGFSDIIEYFMISKGIPKDNVSEFKINYIKSEKTLEIIIPKMFLFQNLTYVKFSLAMDLQTHLADEIEDVKFIEIFEKIPVPPTPTESIAKKVEAFNKEHDHDHDHSHDPDLDQE